MILSYVKTLHFYEPELNEALIQQIVRCAVAALNANKIKKSCLEVSQILKALAHPQRLLILGNLLQGPKTVSELVANCEASQSQISHFLMRMKLEGLIKAEREGKFVIYSVADARLLKLMLVIQSQYCEL